MTLETLQQLKGTGKGKRILVLGNAKSLLRIPIQSLDQDLCTFTMNRIASHLKKNYLFQPTFYLCGTMRVGWDNAYMSDFYTAISRSVISFIGTRIQHKVDLSRIEKHPHFWVDLIDIVDTRIEPPKEEYWRRPTDAGYISIYGHTGFGAIQLARFMEFDEIILGGMDLPYRVPENKDLDPNHYYYGYETGRLQPKPEQYEMYNKNLEYAHEFTARKAKEEGIKIYSLETNYGLDYYERIKLNELI